MSTRSKTYGGGGGAASNRSRSATPQPRRGRASSASRVRGGRSVSRGSATGNRGRSTTPRRSTNRRATVVGSNEATVTPEAMAPAVGGSRPTTPRFNRSTSVHFEDDGLVERGRRIGGRSSSFRRATPWADDVDSDDDDEGVNGRPLTEADFNFDEDEDSEGEEKNDAVNALYDDIEPPFKRSFATHPFARQVDYGTKAGYEYWKKATGMPRNTSPVDLVIKNASKWMDLHLTKKHLHPFKATWVPTEGSGLVYRGLTAGVIADPRTCVDAHGFRDLISLDLKNELSIDQILAWSSWIHGGADQQLKQRELVDGVDAIHHFIDLKAPGILGEFNRFKHEMRIDDEILFEYLKNSTPATSWPLIEKHESKYRYWSPEEFRFVYSGIVVFKIQYDIMNPTTLHMPKKLMDVVTKTTLKSKDYNFILMVSDMETAQLRIQREHGATLCSNVEWMEHFWRALDLDGSHHNDTFKAEAIRMRAAYFQKRPNFNKDSIIADLAALYINLEASGEWTMFYGKSAAKQNPIIALATAQKQQQKEYKAIKDTQDKILSGQIAISKAPVDKPKFEDVEAWRKFKTKQFITGPKDGLKYEWCEGPHGTYRGGMYMKAPHNHQEWWASKPFNKGITVVKRDASAANDTSASVPGKKAKLAIDKNTQQAALTTVQKAALTTKLQGYGFADAEIASIIEEAEASKE